MCNAIPILSPSFLYHPYIPQSLIQRISYFLASLLFMHACIHKYSLGLDVVIETAVAYYTCTYKHNGLWLEDIYKLRHVFIA